MIRCRMFFDVSNFLTSILLKGNMHRTKSYFTFYDQTFILQENKQEKFKRVVHL